MGRFGVDILEEGRFMWDWIPFTNEEGCAFMCLCICVLIVKTWLWFIFFKMLLDINDFVAALPLFTILTNRVGWRIPLTSEIVSLKL